MVCFVFNSSLIFLLAADGVLQIAEKYHVHLKESWYEKLHRYSDALRVYEKIEKRAAMGLEKLHPDDRLSLIHRKIRCYHALGEWRQVLTLARYIWMKSDFYRPKVIVICFGSNSVTGSSDGSTGSMADGRMARLRDIL